MDKNERFHHNAKVVEEMEKMFGFKLSGYNPDWLIDFVDGTEHVPDQIMEILACVLKLDWKISGEDQIDKLNNAIKWNRERSNDFGDPNGFYKELIIELQKSIAIIEHLKLLRSKDYNYLRVLDYGKTHDHAIEIANNVIQRIEKQGIPDGRSLHDYIVNASVIQIEKIKKEKI